MIAVPLETERLRLERLSTKFCTSTYVSWMNDPEVIKYLDSGGDYTLEKLEDFLKGVESKDMLFWAIVDKGLDKHIGNIKIDPFSIMHHRGEYGILIGDKTAWGKGYAKEASIEVINYCFKNLNMKKVTLGVVADNVAALALYKNIGFEEEGLMKSHGFYNGAFHDVIRMAIFNDGFQHNKE